MANDRGLNERRGPKAFFGAILIVGAVAAVTWAAHGWAERRFLAELEERGRAALALHTEVLRGWLGRFRSLVPTYAHDPQVVSLLRAPEDGIRVDLVNRKLELWNSASGAADTYLLDATGHVIAASNWNEPVSFVGQDFSFRPYFEHAMQGRLGRYFALGTTSGKRGYYFSFPVRDGGPSIGVMVVKVPVDAIEQELRASAVEVFVTDAAGVIILAGHPNWRLKTLGPLSEAARDDILNRRQFGADALAPVPIRGLDRTDAVAPPAATPAAPTLPTVVRAVPDRSQASLLEFLHLSSPMVAEDWTLHLLLPTRAARVQINTVALLAGSMMLVLVLAGLGIRQRRRRLMERLAERERARAALQQAVAERTADLRATNLQLAQEVDERIQAESDLRQAQSDLVQAGKLASLGQMSTALSHEFNQPLAAIRTYAENAVAFLDRGNQERAEDNLRRIALLTERMARMSRHLTTFARKPGETLEPVQLDEAIDQTLELLRGRLDKAGAEVRVEGTRGLYVLGGQTRLQHVLMNLVGNAIDAAADRKPEIAVRIRLVDGAESGGAKSGGVEVAVEDNGGGILPEAIDRLFDPFFTTKEQGKGLGLGLSITYNIVHDFGGTIRAENLDDGGARFVVVLHRADPAARPAAEAAQ